jgi:hypothetical protein
VYRGSPRIIGGLLFAVDYCGLVHFGLTIDLGLLSHGVDIIDVDIASINSCTLGGCHMAVRVVLGQHGGITPCVEFIHNVYCKAYM